MRILVLCADRSQAESMAERLSAGSIHQVVRASGFEQALHYDLNGFDAALVWFSLLHALEESMLHAYTQVSRRMPVVAVLSRSAWSERRPRVLLADGWVFLDEGPVEPAAAIRLATAGYWVLPDFVVRERLRLAVPSVACRALSNLQLTVLRQLGTGRTNREIANHLRFSEPKVKKVVHELITRLGLTNRTQVAVFAALAEEGGERESQAGAR
ncbi:MAG: LuxR C-terminal-related transcriptional regulator [Tistlia sp.]|uniref:response regulator transcription factor n=1 Tax=Tistlia sp. TaxID=3057121 RepID=UPI0034A50F98